MWIDGKLAYDELTSRFCGASHTFPRLFGIPERLVSLPRISHFEFRQMNCHQPNSSANQTRSTQD
jgi:hypothetical protein